MRNAPRFHLLIGILALATLLAVGTGVHAAAQAPPVSPSFEVSTVKLVDPTVRFQDHKRGFWVHVYPTKASYQYMTLSSLFGYAYELEPYQIVGPDWINKDRFDITAVIPNGAKKGDDRAMLKTLLSQRFKITFHTEMRPLNSYVLVVGKHGINLRPAISVMPGRTVVPPSNEGSVSLREEPASSSSSSTYHTSAEAVTQTTSFDPAKSAIHLEVSSLTLGDFAERIRTCLGQGTPQVLDQTGVKGSYQMSWDCPLPTAPGPEDDGVNEFSSSETRPNDILRQSLNKLGLSLEKHKAVTKVYVIDHAETPSPD